jgi:hypothetical protein
MQDRLKKRVEQNRSQFEFYQTDFNSLWGEIERGIDQDQDRSTKPVIWRIAAAIVLLMVSVVSLLTINTSGQEGLALHEISIELAETERYYMQQINQRMQVIDAYPEVSSQAKLEIMALDSIYNELKVDLKDNIDNEEVVSAMIENYRLKLELLEGILQNIRKEENNEEDEADEYFL